MAPSYFEFLSRFAPLLLKGAWMTVQLLLYASSLSFLLGSLFGLLTSRAFTIKGVTPILESFTFILRGVPFFVQLLIAYFVLPDLLGFNIEPFPTSVVSLGICSSGYMAQIIRGGINAIPEEQWESAFQLGFNKLYSFWYVIFPQALRRALPMINNEVDGLLKTTATVSTIGMLELTRVGMNIVAREMNPVAVYLTIALVYVCMSLCINLIMRGLEQRLVHVKS